jgi:hypothetical protein
MYMAEAGAREYVRQHGSPGDDWHEMFPIGVRRMAATKWRDEFEEEFRLGNYDHLVPKKYQAASRKKPGKQKKTYKITQYGTDARVALGSDGESYSSRRMPSGQWSAWRRCSLVPS